MSDISNLTNQVRQNIAEQQKNRSNLENNSNKLNNNVSGTLTSQISQIENKKSEGNKSIQDLSDALKNATDDVEREKISSELNDAKDFVESLDEDISNLNMKNAFAQHLSKSITTGDKLQDEIKQLSKSTSESIEKLAKQSNKKSNNDYKEDVESDSVSRNGESDIIQTMKTTLDALPSITNEISVEMNKSKSVLNKTLNGGQ